jgi:hypothetical protein
MITEQEFDRGIRLLRALTEAAKIDTRSGSPLNKEMNILEHKIVIMTNVLFNAYNEGKIDANEQ